MTQVNAKDTKLIFRQPTAKDGGQVWQLVKKTGVLDLNTSYCYIMLCDYFNDTCAVAEEDGQIVGYVSAFRSPKEPRVLFIWQVAVAESQRGKGVATSLILHLLKRTSCLEVDTIELTISPSNTASQALFHKIAKTLNCDIQVQCGYPNKWFPEGAHEREELYRIGPFLR